MKQFWLAVMTILGLATAAAPAQASVQISIDLTTQRMHVRSSSGAYSWPVSTARAGFVTPRGSYAPYSLQRMHYSRAYDNAPMPYSIFFRGGYAIHGTGATGALGRPASHGCIRLAPGNAAALFAMVQREGARITITGSPPASGRAYAKASTRGGAAYAAHTGARPAMAYAPRPMVRDVRGWQRDPFGW